MSIEDDYAGEDVVVAARIGALASSDQILISADLADHIQGAIPTRDRHSVSLKGIPREISVVTVDWREAN
jgi:class 3 adenylate cyclase